VHSHDTVKSLTYRVWEEVKGATNRRIRCQHASASLQLFMCYFNWLSESASLPLSALGWQQWTVQMRYPSQLYLDVQWRRKSYRTVQEKFFVNWIIWKFQINQIVESKNVIINDLTTELRYEFVTENMHFRKKFIYSREISFLVYHRHRVQKNKKIIFIESNSRTWNQPLCSISPLKIRKNGPLAVLDSDFPKRSWFVWRAPLLQRR
jgi:hypothetical protein